MTHPGLPIQEVVWPFTTESMPFLPLVVLILKENGSKECSGSLIAVVLVLALTMRLGASVWLSHDGDVWVPGHLLLAAGKRQVGPHSMGVCRQCQCAPGQGVTEATLYEKGGR